MSMNPGGISSSIITAAAGVAGSVSARAVLAYFDAVADPAALRNAVPGDIEVIFICRSADEAAAASEVSPKIVTVPAFELTRMDQIKMATLLAFSQGLLKGGDVFVFLVGVTGRGVDTMVVMRVGDEFELFQSVGQPKLTEHIRRPVFERVLTLCLELGHEGREGKPVGALFVIGDHANVDRHCQIGRINPFRGYTEKQRNILDDSMRDTVKELAKLDGAFVLKGNGVIISAGTTLHATLPAEMSLPGLGARHAAAAAITACTQSVAVSLSESTGTVRVWRRGSMITEIEKAPRPGASPTNE